MNMNSTSASTGITTIFDLNDDCLFEVLDYLELTDLCTVTQVSSRLRRTAQAYFAYSRFKKLDLWQELECYKRLNVDETLLRTTIRALIFVRPHLTSFRDSGILEGGIRGSGKMKYQRLITSLLNRSENLVELDLSFWHLTDEILSMLRPLFGRLRKFALRACNINDGSFLNMLPLWSPELRELELVGFLVGIRFSTPYFNGLQVQFAKLTTIICDSVPALGKTELEHFLKLHSHLKAFKCDLCGDCSGDCVIRLIATHVPDIETLDLCLYGKNYSAMYFGQLSKLKSLKLHLKGGPPDFTLSVLTEIGTANIQLKQLQLHGLAFERERDVERFVTAFSKLNKLEILEIQNDYRSLECGYADLTALNIIAICKHLAELSTLKLLLVFFKLTVEDITEITRISPKLQLLKLWPNLKIDSEYLPYTIKICIDAEIFKKLVAIVETGCKDRRLKIQLEHAFYSTNIPSNLSQKALSIEVHKFYSSHRYKYWND